MDLIWIFTYESLSFIFKSLTKEGLRAVILDLWPDVQFLIHSENELIHSSNFWFVLPISPDTGPVQRDSFEAVGT